MQEKKWKVYKHKAPNEKIYIGITSQDPERRWQNGYGYATQQLFWRAIQKYGWENIQHEILEENLTKEEAFQKEKYYIDIFKSNQREYGYNVTSGGDGCKDTGNPVAQLLNGEIINVFSSLQETAERLQMSHGAIRNYVTDGQIHGGYLLKIIPYEEYLSLKNTVNNSHLEKFRQLVLDEKSKKIIKRNREGSISICQYTLDGKFIKIYSGVNLAQNETGITNISYALKHKGSQAGGFLWKYDDGDYNNIQPYHANGKRVCQINKDTKKIVATYDSMVDAERITGIKFRQIWKVCNGQTNSSGGYIWRYEGDINNLEVNVIKGIPKRVYKINKETKEIISEYTSMSIASKENNIKSISKISDVCKGKAKTAGGFIWRYVDEVENNIVESIPKSY